MTIFILLFVIICFAFAKIGEKNDQIFELEKKEFFKELKEVLSKENIKTSIYSCLCYGNEREDTECLAINEKYYLYSYFFDKDMNNIFKAPFAIFEVDDHWYQDGCDEAYNIERFENKDDCLEKIKEIIECKKKNF